MRKLTLISILAISMLSLAGCSSASSLSSKSDTEISDTSEISNETKSEIVDKEEIEETSSEVEEPQLEPVIALSYEDYEFDISNMTYKDLLAFFQAIGYPASSDNRDYEVEPYGYLDEWHGPEITINVGDTEVSMTAAVYNPTGETIRALDAKIYSISNLTEITDDKLEILGINVTDFKDNALGALEERFSEIGFNNDIDSSVYVKRLDDGREVTWRDFNDILEITPVYDYGTY